MLVGRPGLDHGHRDARILGKPCRDNASRGAAADDEIVGDGHAEVFVDLGELGTSEDVSITRGRIST